MPTCFSVSNSIGLTATPPYTVEHSGRANNSIVNVVDSMEFCMAGSTSGLGRRPLKAETCVRITYLSPIWPLGQGKVVYLSDRKRWFAYHQRSPFMVAWTRESRPLLRREAVARMPPAITIYPLHKVHCVKSLPFTQVGRLFGVFQLSSSGGLSETGKLTRGLVVCFRPSTKKRKKLVARKFGGEVPHVFTGHLNTNGAVALRWIHGCLLPASNKRWLGMAP